MSMPGLSRVAGAMREVSEMWSGRVEQQFPTNMDADTMLTCLRAGLFGISAGIRSATPLALLALAGQDPLAPINDALSDLGPLAHLRTGRGLAIATLAAGGELLADKLPFVPSRTRPVVLGQRLATGALYGAVASRAARQSVMLGGLCGAAGAGISAIIATRARKALAHRTHTPQQLWGLVGDGAAIGCAWFATRLTQ